MPIDIRGNTLSFLRTELTGNNSRSVLVISREGYRLRNLMDTTGRFLGCYHWCLEMAPSVNKLYWAFLCVCAWSKYEGDNLQGTQSCWREGIFKKKVFGNIYCFDFSEKLSPLPISGILPHVSFFWELSASSPLYPRVKWRFWQNGSSH